MGDLGKRAVARWPFILAALIVVVLLSNYLKTIPPSPQDTNPASKAEDRARDKKMVKAIAGALTLKNAMRNPDSFKIHEASLMENGSVCYEYISQNGFGGMNRETAVLPASIDTVQVKEMKGFRKAWNKECTGKSGESIGEFLNIALKK